MKLSTKIITGALFLVCAAFAQRDMSATIPYVDILNWDMSNMENVKYVFHNIIPFDGKPFGPPFPYSDGRVRDGKYKASQTALENYLNSLSNYNDKIFTIVKLEAGDFNMAGAVMACENGDTLFFQGNSIDGLFITEAFQEKQKKRIGSKIKVKANFRHQESQSQAPTAKLDNYFYGCKEKATGKMVYTLEPESEWTIKAVYFDVAYIGSPNLNNSSQNMRNYDRYKFTITNPKLGEYECFLNNLKESFEP